MKTIELLNSLKFGEKGAHAEPLHVDPDGRVILFTLKPGQSIREHNVPSSPFFVVVLKGEGVFVGEDGAEQRCGPNTLLVFNPGEQHAVRALEDLVFVSFLHGAPGAQIH